LADWRGRGYGPVHGGGKTHGVNAMR
jgi:hypothetical protein